MARALHQNSESYIVIHRRHQHFKSGGAQVVLTHPALRAGKIFSGAPPPLFTCAPQKRGTNQKVGGT
jgi:hypothetical protein